MDPTYAFYYDLPGGYTWTIGIPLKGGSDSVSFVMTTFGSTSGGGTSWDADPNDDGFLYEGDHFASLPPVSSTTTIVLLEGQFPLPAYQSIFSWHRGTGVMNSMSDRPLFPPGKSGATS